MEDKQKPAVGGKPPKRAHAPRPAPSKQEATYLTLDDAEEGKPKYGRQDQESKRADDILNPDTTPEKYEVEDGGKDDDRWTTLLPAHPISSTPTAHIFVILVLFVAFLILVVSAGGRCATSGSCSTNKIPSLFALVYSMDTSLLTISALCCLMGMHFVLNWALLHRLKDSSTFVSILLILVGLGLYAMVFVSLIVPQWFITFIPMSVTALWAVLVMLGLRLFFLINEGKKKMFYFSAFLCTVYTLSVVLYIAFSAVPYELVPHKDIGILVLEIVMASSLVAFCLSLLYYIRGVTFTVTVAPWKRD
jgi:hypothetical protein